VPRLRPSLLLLASLTACNGGDHGKPPPAQAERVPVVRVRPLEVRSVRREIDTTGFLESEHQVVVYSKIQGRVIDAPFDEGAIVKAGQVLARLDPREGEASVRQAEVLLEDRKVRRDLQKLEVDSSRRRVVQAKNDRARLEAEWKRFATWTPR
jgi:multidrug efflux pump subunit AcrA (membrane-fusion protein)